MPRTDPSDRSIRARRGGETSFFAFPAEDVRGAEWTPLDDVPGHVAVAWEAVDEWLNEEELLGPTRATRSRGSTFAALPAMSLSSTRAS